MPKFRPKTVLAEARQAESRGARTSASQKYAKLADYLMRRGNFEAARSLLARSLRLVSTSPRVYLEMAACEAALGNVEASEKAVDRFTEYAISKRKMMEYGPLVEKKLSHLPQLRAYFYQGLLELEPGDAGPYLGLAHAHLALGEKEAAKRALIQALTARGRKGEVVGLLRDVLESLNNMEGLFYLQRYEQGELDTQQLLLSLDSSRSKEKIFVEPEDEEQSEEKELDEMIESLEHSLGIEHLSHLEQDEPRYSEFHDKLFAELKSEPRGLMDLAIAYFEMGLESFALQALKAIPEQNGLYPFARCLEGEFLYHDEKYLPALDAFQSTLRLEALPFEIECEARYRVVEIYSITGDLPRAWENIEALKEISPDYRDLRQLHRKIKQRIERLKKTA